MKIYGIDMKKLYIMMLVAALGACSTDKMTKVPESAGLVPDWFASEPQKDNTDIVVTATDISKDMQFAIDKAMMNARVELANRISTRVESIVRETVVEDSGSKVKDVEREVDRVSKQVTNQVLSMYTREKLVVVKEGGGFRAFVMLKLSEDQGRKLFSNARKIAKDRETAFRELDQEIENAKKR